MDLAIRQGLAIPLSVIPWIARFETLKRSRRLATAEFTRFSRHPYLIPKAQ